MRYSQKEYKNWNPIFNLVVKIVREYKKVFYYMNSTSFEEILKILDNEEYNNIFEPLQVNQHGSLLLIRYGLAEMQKGMWEDPKSIYRECRSVVIDIDKEELVIAPFMKFFNLNEVEENKIERIMEEYEESEPEIVDKLDGSMQCASIYNGEVFMSGSMSIHPANSWRLRDSYEFLTDNYKIMIKNHPEYTFIFEFISLRDAHVVKYQKEDEGLYLIGMRDKRDGSLMWRNAMSVIAERYNVPLAQEEEITLPDLLEKMKTLKSCEKEGWVIRFYLNHPIKIKCDDYVQIHRLLDKYSSVNVVIQNVAEDRIDDMMSKIPDAHKEKLQKIVDRILNWKENKERGINMMYKAAPKGSTKEFMIWVDQNCPSDLAGYIKAEYLGKPYNLLKNKVGGYKKGKDLGLIFFNYEEVQSEKANNI